MSTTSQIGFCVAAVLSVGLIVGWVSSFNGTVSDRIAGEEVIESLTALHSKMDNEISSLRQELVELRKAVQPSEQPGTTVLAAADKQLREKAEHSKLQLDSTVETSSTTIDLTTDAPRKSIKSERVAIAVKTMAPIREQVAGAIRKLHTDLQNDPKYDLVLLIDATKLKPNDQFEPSGVIDPSVKRIVFNESIIRKANPAAEHIWFTFPRENGKKGYQCCMRPFLWQFQNIVINYWLGLRREPNPYAYVWMMQDDIAAFHHGEHVEVKEMKKTDLEHKEDVIGFEFVRSCPQQGCPGWGGSWAVTPNFKPVLAKLKKDRVRQRCYSDGVQRLSAAFIEKYEEAISDHMWYWAEGMIQPLAHYYGLSYWTWTAAPGHKDIVNVPPCARQALNDTEKQSRKSDSITWQHLALQKR